MQSQTNRNIRSILPSSRPQTIGAEDLVLPSHFRGTRVVGLALLLVVCPACAKNPPPEDPEALQHETVEVPDPDRLPTESGPIDQPEPAVPQTEDPQEPQSPTEN